MFLRKIDDVVKGKRGYNRYRADEGFAKVFVDRPITYKYNKNTRLRFGKYKNQVIKNVLIQDIEYIGWLLKNTNCTMSEDIIVELKDKKIID